MTRLGLVGKNIQNSLSPKIYEELLKKKIKYHLFDFEKESSILSLEELFEQVDGLSVTSPYKKHFLSKVFNPENFLAINTIKKVNDQFIATNTDLIAFEKQYQDFLNKYKKVELVLLGDGAMAELIAAHLKNHNFPFEQFSREKNADFYNRRLYGKQDSQLIVLNCCSRDFRCSNEIEKGAIFWDLNYNHEFHLSRFLDSGIHYLDGQKFLQDQAITALKFWNLN